jgi:O-antigen/teichoic acid export membrane protein
MTQQSSSPKNVSKKAVQGTLWSYLSFVCGKGLNLASTLILTRLLAPAEFGVMAYCLTAIQYLDVLNSLGSESALISRRDKLEEATNATFVINILTGILFFSLAWAAAPALAAFFREPGVVDVIRVLAAVLVIGALKSAPSGLLQRRLSFKAKLIPDLGQAVVKGLVSVILAWQGFGVWSLVWGQVIGEAVSTVAFWVLVRWRPTLQFDRQITRETLLFGGNMALIGFIGALLINVDYLIVGRILGSEQLGYYTLGYRIPDLLIRSIGMVVGQVAFPVLALLQTDMQKFHVVYLKYLRYLALCTYPIGAGLALTAPYFVTLFFTAKWIPATFPMQAIAIALALSSLGRIPGVLYKAMNRPEILNQIGVVKLAFAVTVLWIGAQWGINGVAVAQIAVATCNMILDFTMVSRVIKVQFNEMLKSILPPLIGVTVMWMVLTALSALFTSPGIVSLGALIVAGVVVYTLALAIVSRETLKQASLVLRLAFSRS